MTPETTSPARRPWWQTLPFLILLGVVPVPFGLYFAGFIGIALLLSDRTRETEVKAGGAVALFWWAYSFREGATSPYLGATLLAISTALFARGALTRRSAGSRLAWVPAAAAVGTAVLAVVAFVPDGYRKAEVSRDEAASLVLAERSARPWKDIRATSYLVESGRARIVHTPLWFVVLYEPNATVARTVDGQPCFSRREVWRVNAIDGEVSRVTHDEAAVGGDPCLPVRIGTEKDLEPVPA